MMSFSVKVCGMRDADNIRAVEALGIDMMGFIFWPKSSRYVAERPAYLPTECKRVGVFVDEDVETVRKTADDYALDYIQLHGHETPEYCAQLEDYRIIKAFNVATADDLSQTSVYAGFADLFLFDTKGKSVGGNGEKFDWNVLSHYDGDTPFLLSGGIGPDDDSRVKAMLSNRGISHTNAAFLHPKCIGIDLNSRFELAPALKDVLSLSRFLNEINRK